MKIVKFGDPYPSPGIRFSVVAKAEGSALTVTLESVSGGGAAPDAAPDVVVDRPDDPPPEGGSP